MQSAYYERYWERHDRAWFPSRDDRLHADERALFQRYLPKKASVLDYGCGDGHRYGRYLTANGFEYVGYDVSGTAVEEARRIGVSAEVLNQDSTTNLPDRSVDAIICFEVLEHVIDTESILKEFQRVLKPGGTAMISVPNMAHYANRLEFLLHGFISPGGSPETSRARPWMDPHIRFYSPATLRRMFEKNGFRVDSTRAEIFHLSNLPFVWKIPPLRRALEFIGYPLRFLGKVWPSLFSTRIFIAAQLPE